MTKSRSPTKQGQLSDNPSDSKPSVLPKQQDWPQSGQQARHLPEGGKSGEYSDQQLANRLDKLPDQYRDQQHANQLDRLPDQRHRATEIRLTSPAPGERKEKLEQSSAVLQTTASVGEQSEKERAGKEQDAEKRLDAASEKEDEVSTQTQSAKNETEASKQQGTGDEPRGQLMQRQKPFQQSLLEKEQPAGKDEDEETNAAGRGQEGDEKDVKQPDKVKGAGGREEENEYGEDEAAKDKEVAAKPQFAGAPVGDRQIPAPPSEAKQEEYQDNDEEYEVNKDRLRQNAL